MNHQSPLMAEIAAAAALVDQTIADLNRLFDESIARLEEICTRPLTITKNAA